MRLSFPGGDSADFVVEESVQIGRAPGNALIVSSDGVAPWHARIRRDARGIVLEVLEPGAPTHLNGRPVRERALLQLGDSLCLGSLVMVLRPRKDDSVRTSLPPDTPVPTAAVNPPRVVLRGRVGRLSGRCIAVNPWLELGRDAGCDLQLDEARLKPRHARLELSGERLVLRGLDPQARSRVNGVPVRDAILHPGDVLGFGNSQFLVEAPGLPGRDSEDARARIRTARMEAVTAPQQGASPNGIWWLIGVAAMLAGALMVLFQRGL